MEFRDLKAQYRVLKDEINAGIQKVMESGAFIGGGPVQELEEQLADYVGVRHCISCANGTDALTLALKAWGIGKGDAVFVPDFTFFASGECPAVEGAVPVFVDVDGDTCNINVRELERAVLRVLDEGKYKPRVVLAVDLFGQPADYVPIRAVCDKYKLLLLEDGAQGFGGAIRGKMACSFGDISTTSFFPAKPLGCYGDGGAVFTNHDEWADRIRSIAIHGKCGADKYDNIRLGINSRLDTIQAAILLPKLKAFREYELERVKEAAGLYNKLLAGSGLKLPYMGEGCASSWAQYTVQLPKGTDRSAIQTGLLAKNIPSMVYYSKPMHRQGAFTGTDSAAADCPVTEQLCRKVLSLPIHPYLDEAAIQTVAGAVLDMTKDERHHSGGK